ncbi:MAG: HNH endonuclease [Aeriscardovia sp.]|nr:HNH endonuclease [Aeriscardovia sp.]
MNKRTRAVSIPTKVKRQVEERDHGQCIFCGCPGKGEAHFIARSQGGLGIEENLLTVCRPCHDKLDNSTERKKMLGIAEGYLKRCYPYWDKSFLIYEKGINTKARVFSIREEYEKQRTLSVSQAKNVIMTKPPEGFYFLEEENNDGGCKRDDPHNL